MTRDDQVKRMVERFLSWRLPEHFNPDAGISFDPVFNKGTKHEMRHQPCGTNLFDYEQATVMVQYMIEGLDQSLSERIAVLEGENAKLREVVESALDAIQVGYPREARNTLADFLQRPSETPSLIKEGRDVTE